MFNKIRAITALLSVLVFSLGGLITANMASATTTTVDLLTAAPFAILAGTPNITDSPTSTIVGNVGLSPAGGSAIGLLCTQVTGTIYAVDGTGNSCFTNNGPLLVTAKNDLITAYDDAAGRTPVTTVPTELGGTTKTAGVYNSTSTTFGITSTAGPLVLDGQGDSTAVFIFEMNFDATGLTVGPASVVSLINGAQACNVFWRLNTASINTTAVFKGTIMALTSITVANGANIEGRLLARNGSVTLINDTITRPICTVASVTAVTTPVVTTPATTTPKLPSTGNGLASDSIMWMLTIPAAIIIAVVSYYLGRRKRYSDQLTDKL